MTAAPGVAAPGNGAEKTTYYAFECFDEPIFTAPPKIVGNTIHVRDAIGHADEFLYDDGDWVPAGENNTVINFNGKLGLMGPGDLRLWGTFDLELTDIGNFVGTWASGRATGKADDGRLIKVDLDPSEDDFTDGPYPCPGTSDAIYEIIDPGH